MAATLAPAREAAGFRVSAYLPDYRASSVALETLQGVTDLILFSAELEAAGEIRASSVGAFPWAELQRWRVRTGGKLWLAVGGWGKSGHFSSVAMDAGLRQRLAASLMRVCADRGLDGIDFDWEHPAGADQERAYGELLATVRDAFRPQHLLTSVTIAGWQRLTPLAIESADVIQLMAYDQPGNHSTFEGAVSDVQKVIRSGVPAAKLMLGLPFYGRHKTDRNRTQAYSEILERHHFPADVDDWDGMYFNGPTTIRRKVTYAREMPLRGVMVWELGQDAAGKNSLLSAVISSARTETIRQKTP